MGFKLKKIKTGIKFLDKKLMKGIGNAAELFGQKSPFKASSAGPPGEDPKVRMLREKMQDEASAYRQQLPGLIQEQDVILRREGDEAEREGVQATRKNMNDRGLLYSGLRESSEGDVKSRVASGLARSMADVRKGFQDTAAAKENTAAQVGLAGYQGALDRAAQTYEQQMVKNTQARQNMQALGQAGGYAAGAYNSGAFNKAPQQQPAQVGSSYYARPADYDYYSQPSGLMNA